MAARICPTGLRMVITQRSLRTAGAGLLAVATVLGTIAAGMPRTGGAAAPAVLHITPDGAGARDGTSWRNAGTLDDLPRFITRSAPGDEVWIRGDLGPYRTSRALPITAGGTRTAPVLVRGVAGDGSARATPRIVGTRSDPYRADGDHGGELFKLLRDADHLRFHNLAFANQGNGVFRIGADIRDLTITGMRADNVRRFVENYRSGDEPTATIDGLYIEDVVVRGFSKSVVRLRYATNDVVIRDVYGDSERQDGDPFAMGVHLDDTVHHVLMDRVTMRNSHDSRGPSEYWNGDGFVAERGTHHIELRDTVATGSTDSGYDLKGTATTLVRARASGNKRNFRFWGTATAFGCAASSPRNRGGTGGRANVWAGSSARVRLIGCSYRDEGHEAQLFDLDDAARVVNVHQPGARLAPTTVDATATLRQVSLIDAACSTRSTPAYRDTSTSAHRAAIACVTQQGIAQGTSDRTFAPAAVVTRGQMATLVVNLIERSGGTLPASRRARFRDVDGSTHEASIERLAAAGLVGGFADGAFRPALAVTRAQMASFIDRAIAFAAGAPLRAGTLDAFDDDVRSVHEGAINRLAHAGVVLGGRTGRFATADKVRRDQMASLLARSLGVLTTG